MNYLAILTCVFLTVLGSYPPFTAAQDNSPHTMHGTLAAPKLGLRFRGRYTVQLSPGETSGQFKMEICPTRPSGTSKNSLKKVRRAYVAIAQLVCRDKSVSILGEPDRALFVHHGGSGVKYLIGEFHCN